MSLLKKSILITLFVLMIIAPILSAQDSLNDEKSSNHMKIFVGSNNVTPYVAKDTVLKTELNAYGIQKPEELQISSQIKKYDVVKVDSKLNERLKSEKGIIISIGETDYLAELSRMNYENIDDGIDSYYGTIPAIKNSEILFVSSKKLLYGRITLGNETYRIRPVESRQRSETSQSPLHIIYNSNDVINTEFLIDNGPVQIGLEKIPVYSTVTLSDVSQIGSSDLQKTPLSETVWVNILVVTDQEFYELESGWTEAAQEIIDTANTKFGKSDINVRFTRIYDDSHRSHFSSNATKLTDPLGLTWYEYPPSALDSENADIALYLGGNDYVNGDDPAQGASCGFGAITGTEPYAARYAWAQMVPDNFWYSGSDHGRTVTSIHEIGHIFGACHENQEGCPSYAKAHEVIPPAILRTVMWSGFIEEGSLTDFSSNDQSYYYPPLGWFPLGNDDRDNSRNISETRDIVAKYAEQLFTQIGVFRPSTHTFYLRPIYYPARATIPINWGLGTDTPVTGDWDGDGITDIGVFRPSTHTFYLRPHDWSGSGDTITINWGLDTDKPVTGDWDNDGITDVGVFRPSTHTFILRPHYWSGSSDTIYINWGLGTDTPVTGDWDDDGFTEVGVFRPSTHTFYLRPHDWSDSSDTIYINWGLGTDIPVTGYWM